MWPRIERTVSQRKKNEKIFLLVQNFVFWNLCDLKNLVGSITTDKSDVDFFVGERSIIIMNSSFIRIKHDLVKKNPQNECCVFKVSLKVFYNTNKNFKKCTYNVISLQFFIEFTFQRDIISV